MSFNVAVFNGIDATGTPHSTVEFQSGDTDILMSRTIDLSNYEIGDSIYLSFFYEKKGNGELPNDDDGIRVEFMDEDSTWVPNIWTKTGRETVEADSFYQVLLPVNEEEYFSDKFRFRFIASGRQTGLFDTWLIDYVYLNEGRSDSDDEYPDRTFTKPISSPFKDYYSIPIEHFISNPNFELDSMGSQYTQLGSTNEVQQYELNVIVNYINEDETTEIIPNQQLTTVHDNKFDFNGLGNPYDRRDFEVDSIVSMDGLPSTAIYAEIEATLLGSKWIDGMLGGSIDLNINDTIRNTFIMDNYYAYDDGTAERGAGINITGNQIAYEFGLQEINEDAITAVDIYFPKTIESVQFGKQVKLKIWSQQNGLPGDELFAKDILIQKVDTLNQFYRYELNEGIAVADTFYIGWEQLAADRIYVGLDKNTNSEDHIYFNTTGEWEQNINDIVGSLMIRPVFGEVKEPGIADPTSIISDAFDQSIKIFPNPTNGAFRITGDFDELSIIDLSGRKINFNQIKESNHTDIVLHGLPKGMYLIQLRKGILNTTKKIILNR